MKGKTKDWLCPLFYALIISLIFLIITKKYSTIANINEILYSIKSIGIQFFLCFIAGLFSLLGIIQALATSYLNRPEKTLKTENKKLYLHLISRYRFFTDEGGFYTRFRKNLKRIIYWCAFSTIYCIFLEIKIPWPFLYINLFHATLLVGLISYVIISTIQQIDIIFKF